MCTSAIPRSPLTLPALLISCVRCHYGRAFLHTCSVQGAKGDTAHEDGYISLLNLVKGTRVFDII